MSDYPPLICGIDPGAAGGIAALGRDSAFVEAHRIPETRMDLVELIAGYHGAILRAYVEQVHSFPGQGVVSSFSFGKGYGEILGIMTALRIPVVDVSPVKWKKALGLRFTADDSKKDKKNASKELAQQWWPYIKVTHSIAEALLIAEFGRRQP